MPRKAFKGGFASVLLTNMHEVPGPNPNAMTPEQEAELRESIWVHGYRQAITLVERIEGGYWISDGVHRRKILMELGYEHVPCIIKEGDENTVRAERLSLNRIRGQVDLGLAAADVRLLDAEGMSGQHLGFTDAELAVLMRVGDAATEATILEDALEAGPAGPPAAESAKRYTLTLTFDHREERDALRAKLLALGASVEEGLRSLLGRGT